MSLRIDSTEWIAGSLIIGDTGLGVLGSEIPSTGDHGAAYAYNDLTLPGDADKEICGRITTWPTLGTLTPYEDTSFDYEGLSDSFYYQLYVDGVAVGSPTQVTITAGSTNASVSVSVTGITLTAPIGAASGTRNVVASGLLAQIALIAAQGSATGTTAGSGIGAGSVASISILAPNATASGTSAFNGVGSGTIRSIVLTAPNASGGAIPTSTPSAARRYAVPAEDRSFSVAAESRLYAI